MTPRICSRGLPSRGKSPIKLSRKCVVTGISVWQKRCQEIVVETSSIKGRHNRIRILQSSFRQGQTGKLGRSRRLEKGRQKVGGRNNRLNVNPILCEQMDA